MKVSYDLEIDAIYFELSENKVVDSEEIRDRIIYDYDHNDKIVGIEILDFTYQKKQGLKLEDLPFNTQDRLQAKEYFIDNELTIR